MENRSQHVPLDPAELTRGAADAGVPWALVSLEECDSTNREALARAGADPGLAERGLAVFAAWQSAGRGRRGARWRSERDADLLFSVALRPALPTEKWSRLTHVAALALSKALEPQFEPAIKWPNDVYLGGKKVAGILVESEPATGLAVIGIGLNVNSRPADLGDALAVPATSLSAEAGQVIDRNALAAALLRELHGAVARAGDGFPGLLESIATRSALLGRRVGLTLPDGDRIEGIAHHFGAEGELVVEAPDGTHRPITSATQIRLI